MVLSKGENYAADKFPALKGEKHKLKAQPNIVQNNRRQYKYRNHVADGNYQWNASCMEQVGFKDIFARGRQGEI